MKSPFPGMDPYLERHWRGVHHALITYARDQLRPMLPRELRPRIEERVFIESDAGDLREIYPNVHVVEYPKKPPGEGQATAIGAAVVAEPILLHVHREPSSQGYIEIVDAASGNRVVTVIEFVSPSNKMPGDGQKLYLQKQKEVIAAGASLVEIDLTRSGKRLLAGPLELLRHAQQATYMACIRRGWKAEHRRDLSAPPGRTAPCLAHTAAANGCRRHVESPGAGQPVLRERGLRRYRLPPTAAPALGSRRRGLGRKVASRRRRVVTKAILPTRPDPKSRASPRS